MQLSSPIEVQVSTPNEQQNQVTANESSKDAKISPSLIELTVELLISALDWQTVKFGGHERADEASKPCT